MFSTFRKLFKKISKGDICKSAISFARIDSRFAEALKFLKTASKYIPQDKLTLLKDTVKMQIALQNYQLEEFPAAIKKFTQLIESTQNNNKKAVALVCRSNCYGQLGQRDLQLEDFAMAVKLNPITRYSFHYKLYKQDILVHILKFLYIRERHLLYLAAPEFKQIFLQLVDPTLSFYDTRFFFTPRSIVTHYFVYYPFFTSQNYVYIVHQVKKITLVENKHKTAVNKEGLQIKCREDLKGLILELTGNIMFDFFTITGSVSTLDLSSSRVEKFQEEKLVEFCKQKQVKKIIVNELNCNFVEGVVKRKFQFLQVCRSQIRDY